MALDLADMADPKMQIKLRERFEEILKRKSKKELEGGFFRFVMITGFDFMKYGPFIELVREWVERREKRDRKALINLKQLAESLNAYFKPSAFRKRFNEEKYWKIYLAVEEEIEKIDKSENKERSFATSEACRRIAKKLKENFNTIRARYNDKKREANEYGLNDEDMKELIMKL